MYLLVALVLFAITISLIVRRSNVKCERLMAQIRKEQQILSDYDACIAHIKRHEGCELEPYQLDGGWYIGYGHLITKNDPAFVKLTKEQAHELLVEDFNLRYNMTDTAMHNNQRLAVALFMYNLGSETWKNSTMNKMLNGIVEYNESQFYACWEMYCKFKGKVHQGLRTRRQFEIKMYQRYENQ